MKVDFDLRDAVTLLKPTAEMTAFADFLRTPGQRQLIIDTWRPFLERDAASFELEVAPQRARKIKQLFKLMKELAPETFRALKIYRTILGLLDDKSYFVSFHKPCIERWQALKAKEQPSGTLISPKERTELVTKLILLRHLYLVVMTMTADYATELLSLDPKLIKQADQKEAVFRWCRTLQFAFLSLALENNEELKLPEQEEQSSFLEQMTVNSLWFSAAILEFSDHPTPGFATFKGTDPFAVLRKLTV